MKIWKTTFTLLLSAFLFISCNKAESTLSDLKDLVTAVDELPDDYTAQDIQELTNEYKVINEELKTYEYSKDQLKEIGELQGRFAAKITKVSMKVVEKSLEDFSTQMEGGVKGFMEELEKE